ncbi:MAG: hypothetical protein ACFE98_02450 [Candidatus Hermodarchaeota archaeon]
MTPKTTPDDPVSQEIDEVELKKMGVSFYSWAKENIKKQQHKSTISKYKRGLEWDEEQLNETLEDIDSEHPLKNTIININEKQFRLRFTYFVAMTLLPAVGLSIAITAPFTFPWLFKFVIPEIMTIIPSFLADFIRDLIGSIQSFLAIFSWLEPLIDFIMQIAATFNPLLVYMAIMYILNSADIVHDEYYEDPLLDLSNIPSSADFLASDFQMKFGLSFSEITVFLFLISFFISLFLIIGREKWVIFEFLTAKDEKNYLEEIERAFIGYYQDKGYEEINYIKSRFSESPRLKTLAYLVKLSPVLSFVIPVVLVIVFLYL